MKLVKKMSPAQLARLTDEELAALDKIVSEQERKRATGTQVFAQYRDNPAQFAIDVLGITPWSKQVEILTAISQHKKVAVRSGHKVGKTNSIAITALWWFSTRPTATVVLTSSTDTQIERQVWPEIRKLYKNAKQPIGGEIMLSHQTGLRSDDGRRIFGISTNKTDNMGGYSGDELLFLADEASGIEDAIFQAIEGNLAADGTRLAMFGNPIRVTGVFHDAFHDKSEFWHKIHVSSAHTPNVITGKNLIPGLAGRAWVAEKTVEYGGPGCPEYDIRVAGEFPKQGTNGVINSGDVEAAQQRWREPVATDGPLEIGVDVARYGDDETVIYARRGRFLYKPVVLRSMDGIEVATEVVKRVRELRLAAPGEEHTRHGGAESTIKRPAEVPRVKVDVIGVGASAFDQLNRNHRDEVQAIAVNVAESSTTGEHSKLRDQLWFALRDWIREGGTIPDDGRLRSELTTPLYTFDTQGRYKVQSKDDIKDKLRRSPDRADALALAVYSPVEFKVSTSPATFMDY